MNERIREYTEKVVLNQVIDPDAAAAILDKGVREIVREELARLPVAQAELVDGEGG